jgi:hypothetical protein
MRAFIAVRFPRSAFLKILYGTPRIPNSSLTRRPRCRPSSFPWLNSRLQLTQMY